MKLKHFYGLVETISRLEDMKFFLLANSVTVNNPYFIYFNLDLPYNTDIKLFKEGTIAVEYIRNEAYREVKKQTRFGKLIDGTRYGKYAIDNEFLTDSKAFIKKKDFNAKFYFILFVNGKQYGVWKDFKNQIIYISNDIDPNCPIKFAINNDDHNEETVYAKARSNFWFKQIFNYYRLGKLCFESQAIKNLVMEELKRYLNY